MKAYMDFVTQQMRNKGGAAGFVAEIAFLSQEKRSCDLRVFNETPNAVNFIKSYIVRGRASNYIRLDEDIPAKCDKSYPFEKFTKMSLDGCAVMLLFSTDTSESKKCYFLVAFRNYSIQFSRRSHNRAALLLIADPASVAGLMSLQYFGEVMRNENTKPEIGYQGELFTRTFMAVDTSSTECVDFGNIIFSLSITDRVHSVVTVKVSVVPPFIG